MTSLLDLKGLIRTGDTIMWGQSHAEPRTLIDNLIDQREALGRVRIFLGIGLSGQLKAEHASAFDFITYCGSGTNKALIDAGVVDILPTHYSQFPHLIVRGQLKIDVLFLQVSPPDGQGRYSLGMAREYLVPALKQARVIIGEVHADVPWTFGGPYLTKEDFTCLVTSEADLPLASSAKIDETSRAIGRHVASLIEDGATLQTGIGNIPDASLSELHDRCDLGIHTGAIGEGLAKLCKNGAVTNYRKPIDQGISIGGALIGGASLRDFAHQNSKVELRSTEYTHDPKILRQLDRFVAINSAIEVDLTGQINSEVLGGKYRGAVGGILDFLRAAAASEGGTPIIALPSSGRGMSRIVPQLSGPATVPRSDACVIVTEYGVADLRGLSLRERAKALIAIASPDHRETLERHVRETQSDLA